MSGYIIEILNKLGVFFCDHSLAMLIQSSILILILLVVELLLRKRISAILRYCFWLLIFVKLVIPPTLSLPTGIGYWLDDLWSTEPIQVATSETPATFNMPVEFPMVSAVETVADVPVEVAPDTVTPAVIHVTPAISSKAIIFLGWLVGVLILFLLLLQRTIFVKRIIAQSKPAENELTDLLNDCCDQLGVRKNIELRISQNLMSPAACGLIRPKIILPSSLLKHFSSEKIRTTLLHEVAHIKRKDIWINSFQSFLQILYFYNPLLWIANIIVRRIREQAVDETVLVYLGQKADTYSSTLVDIAEIAFARPSLGLNMIGVVESKKALMTRIRHITNRPFPTRIRLGTFHILIIIIAAGILLPMAKGKTDEITEILDKYTKALDPIQSFIASTESTTTGSSDVPSWGLKKDNQTSYSRAEMRTDGKGKTSQASFRWGYINEHIPESNAIYRRIVAGDDFVYHLNKRLNRTEYNGGEYHGTLTYQTPDGENFKRSRDNFGTFTKAPPVSYFLGYFDNRARLDSILKNEAKHIALRPEPEMINGSPCYVIDADTKRGKFTVWFDSEHGYLPARIKAKMGLGDDIGDPGSPGIITKEQGIEREYTLDNVRFEKIEGTWVPMEADYQRIVILGDENGFADTKKHFKFTKITLNPDHEASNSFGNPAKNPELDPELEDGTIVYHIGHPSTTWQNGKVVEDNTGKVVDLENRGPKVGVGQALPGLSEFDVRLEPEVIRDKMLLVCFFDVDQRPSRNAIQRLNKRANSLLEEGLYMVFIQAEAVEEQKIVSWLKRNEIQPPVGMSRSGLSGLEYSWGVKSLPWLILTDKNHIVTAEDFGIAEINDKIKK